MKSHRVLKMNLTRTEEYVTIKLSDLDGPVAELHLTPEEQLRLWGFLDSSVKVPHTCSTEGCQGSGAV